MVCQGKHGSNKHSVEYTYGIPAGSLIWALASRQISRINWLKKPGAPRPRPIVAKFGYFKQKEQVKSRGRELKGTDFSVNDQFPKEILERRKILFPIRRSLIQKGSRAVIAVDRLYVDGQLYRNLSTTPWLY